MRKKINLGFTIIILLVWVICLYTIFSSLSVQKLFNELNDDIVPGAIAMAKMKYEVSDIRSWTLTYILRGNVIKNEKTIKEWLQEDWSDLENAAQIHYEHEKHINIEEQQSAKEIIKLSQKLISASIEIINQKDQGVESDILFDKIKEDFHSAFYPLREVLDEHSATHIKELTDAQIKAQSKYQVTISYIVILGVAVTLLSIFIGLFINKLFIRYITERNKAEKALQESEEKFRTLTENINVGIYRNTVGAKGKFIEANPAIVKMFGFKNKKEFLSYNVSELYLHSEERKKFSDKMLKKGFVKDEELLLKKKDGSPFVGSISAVTIKGNDGNVQFYDGIIEDITERKKMEEEINRHREQLKLINTILRHDLANNLAVIKSAIKIFKVKKDESILDEASLNVNKSTELIHKMREHESLITKESLKVFEISEVIKQVMENYPDIEFAIKGKKEIFADDALNSVIDNIFRNAVVHGKTNRLDIEIGAYKDRCFVKIADNGTGIPDKIKEKIFDEGFKYGKKAHTGMGLYIVKESVEKWGGSIFVEDNKPKGAVFVLILKSVR